jgi:hypothetical protein
LVESKLDALMMLQDHHYMMITGAAEVGALLGS